MGSAFVSGAARSWLKGGLIKQVCDVDRLCGDPRHHASSWCNVVEAYREKPRVLGQLSYHGLGEYLWSPSEHRR
jgi:hypothetical protein